MIARAGVRTLWVAAERETGQLHGESMRRLIGFGGVGLAVVLALAAAACGGGSKASPSVVLPTPTGTPGDPAATAEFNAFVKKFEALPGYSITYDMKSTSDGQNTLSATMSATQKGKQTRSLFDGTVNGSHTKLLTLFDGDHLYICDEATAKACVEPAKGPNFRDPLTVYSPASILGAVASSNNITVHKADSQTINGVQASCYELRQTNSTGTYCFDPASALLLLIDGQTTANGKPATTTMRAKEATAKVDSIDLKPPYAVQAEATATATSKP